MDTTFKTSEGVFNYRVGAIILNGTKALMAHDNRRDQYYTVGGRAHFGETSEQTMLREIFEETGIKAELDRLAFVQEGFFNADGTDFHELAFYWLVKPFDFKEIDFSSLKCDGDDNELCWIDLADKKWCDGKEIYPVWLREKALCIPTGITHIVSIEDNFKKKGTFNDMELLQFFKSIIDMDRSAVVICDLNHIIVYMNKAASERYANRGGIELTGKSLLECHGEKSVQTIEKVVNWFKESKDNNIIYTFHNQKENKDVYMVALRSENGELIGYYEKHEYRNRETMELYSFK